MEVERFHDDDNSLHHAKLDEGNMTSPLVDSRRSSTPAEAERSTPSAGAQPLLSTRRELRWAFPVDDSTARRIGHRSRSSGGTASTAVRGSSLRRRATSPSPQPYPRQRDGGDPRRRSRSTSGGAGFNTSSSRGMFARRQSSSLGPAARPSIGGGAASSWGSRRRQRQWGRPRKLCAAAVSRHVAQHTAGNLLASPRARNGVLLLAGSFAVSCSSLMLFLALWGIVLLAGAALWVRSEPIRTTLLPAPPPAELTGSRFRRRGGAAQLWAAAAAEAESDDGKGAVGGGHREGESTVAVSARKWRDLVVLLALAPPALDATAQFFFLRLAARSCSARLAVGLFIASTVYACLVGASVVVAGVAELKGGEGKFRSLAASWHALLLLTAVGALSQQQWDRTVVPQGLGSVLLSLAAWQLGGLSARRVEGAVRYGLVATAQKALGEASNHELSPESLLELAAGRWLVEYWSQPPTFSAPEVRKMLVQAVSSIARERLLGSTSRRGGGGGGGDGGGRGRSSGDIQDTFVKDGVRDGPELTEAPSPAGGVEALTGWLEGRGSEPPVPKLWHPLETPASASPGWVLVSSEAPLLLRACPTLCASVFLLLRSLVGGAPWMEWAFLLALAGPAAVEVWRLRVLRKELTRKKRDHRPTPPPPPLARRTQAPRAAADRLSLLLRESNPPLENVWKNAVRLAEKLGEDPAGGGGSGGGSPSPRVVDRVVAGVAMTGAADAPRASSPEAASTVPKNSLPVDRDKADIFRAGLAARIGTERVLGGRPRLLKDYLAYSRPRSADSPAYPGRFTGSRTNNSLGLGLARPLAGSSGSLTGATATAVAPTAAPAPTAGVDADAADAAAIETSADAATEAIPVRGDPGDDDAWDLFGATWAGTVVGAAGELAGAIGDVAGGALGSVPVLGGVLEWWGGGGAPEKAEDSVSGGGGCEALAVEKDGTVDGAIDGGTIDGTIDGAANVSSGDGGGGGGVESSGRRAGSSDHSGSESFGALSKAAEGSSGGTNTGMLDSAAESTGQEQDGLLVEDDAPPVADDAPGTARQPAETKNPSVGAPTSIGDAGSEEDFYCDDGGSENEDRREKQRPTSASLSPLYTINDTTTCTSSKGPAQVPPGDDVSNGDGQQQQQQQRESPCAGTNTPPSACRDEGQGGESTSAPEEEHSVDHNKSSIVGSSGSNNDEHDTTTPASTAASLAAREEEERGETDAVESMEATQLVAPEVTGVESRGKAQEAGSGPHGLTGMAWWTVSRAVEIAGGAAYGFLPGFQDAKEAGGERGGGGDDTKEASGEH
ncbi:unnamed protein product [Ectocarpus sp. 8 AP-2014]